MPVAPATGQTTFTFEVRPHSSLDVSWQHVNGQVEIDALFVSRLRGRETVFVVEAKVGSGKADLAKHKLVYPVLALAGSIPRYVDIVPVYLKIQPVDSGLWYRICSLHMPDPRLGPCAIDQLTPAEVKSFILPGFGG